MSTSTYTIKSLLDSGILCIQKEREADKFAQIESKPTKDEVKFYFQKHPFLKKQHITILIHKLLSIMNFTSFNKNPKQFLNLYEMNLNPYLTIFPDDMIYDLLLDFVQVKGLK